MTRKRRLRVLVALPQSRKILRKLAERGSLSDQALARALGISVSETRVWLERLLRYNVIVAVTPREELRLNMERPQMMYRLGAAAPEKYRQLQQAMKGGLNSDTDLH